MSLLEPPPRLPIDWRGRFAARTAEEGGEVTAILSLAGSKDTIAFSGGFPAPETFPVAVLDGLVRELLASDPSGALQYTPTEGLESSRSAIAELLAATQGVRADPAGVLVTSGGIEALQLVTRVMVEPGDVVAVEAPTYLGALTVLSGGGADLRGVAMDEEGIRVDEAEAAFSAGAPKLAYVIPDHQNPTGRTLTLERRRALVESCRRHGVLLVEDVTYRELGFSEATLPSLWSLAPDVVLQIGTFSKILFPGVRLGWAVGPRPVLEAMATAKQSSDQCAGALGQRIMARFVSGGHFGPHLRAARSLYARRAARMQAALARHMPEGARWTRPSGGFFVWVSLGEGADSRALAAEARRLKVAYVPGAPFYAGGGGVDELRLAYSGVCEEEIDEGVARLGRLFGGELDKSA